MDWEREWVRAGRFRCGVCRRSIPWSCVWVNQDTREVRHLHCFTPEGFVPDLCTDEENDHALRADRRYCKRMGLPFP
jgi:hypothetical protein